ncbi:MAG: amidohydrolase [Clostridioides sp.]|nr:amidohydrolase [Clostridioides sp.]
MKIIDAHAHIFEHITGLGRAGEFRAIGNGVGKWADGSTMQVVPEGYGDKEFLVESLLKILDDNNVEKAILLQGILYGFQNEYIHEVAKEHSDRFKAAVTLDPFCKDALKILEHFIVDFDSKIFKFEISIGGGMMGYHDDFIIDSEVMDRLYRRINEVENATLVLDIGSPSMASCQIEAVARIAKKYPDLNIVICHLLAPHKEDEEALKIALPYLKATNVWIDLSALPWNTAPEDYPFPVSLKFIKLAKDILGADKIIWGTDSPAVLTKFDYKDLYTYIMESDVFTEKELEAVFYDNAVKAYYI